MTRCGTQPGWWVRSAQGDYYVDKPWYQSPATFPYAGPDQQQTTPDTSDSSLAEDMSQDSSDTPVSETTSDASNATSDWMPHLQVDAYARLTGCDDVRRQYRSRDAARRQPSVSGFSTVSSDTTAVNRDSDDEFGFYLRHSAQYDAVNVNAEASMNAILRAGNAARARRGYPPQPAARSDAPHTITCFSGLQMSSVTVVSSIEPQVAADERLTARKTSKSKKKSKAKIRRLFCF